MLEIAHLAYAYNGKTIIDIDAFSLPPGQHALLLGPSGSGKSTLLNLLAGILRPQTGTITIAGTELTRLSPRETDAWRGRTVGLLPQQLSLVSSLTARQNLLLCSYANGSKPDPVRIDALLATLGLAGHARAKPHQLSQGQRQRVALARAVCAGPRLILADEPTANLDDRACSAALALMHAVADANNATLIIASHDARVLQALPDARILRLAAREVLQ